jgi:CheY-like chemotaxis protein
MAQRSAASLLGLLNDVLDLTKVEAGMLTLEKMPFNLSSCVRGTIDILLPEARRKGLDLTCACEGTLPETAVGDQLRLRQILTNLLGNAVKFTHSGKVELIVRGGDCMSDGRREVTFVVADTGIGIPEDKGQILFKPFTQADESHTRRYGGTGLGLAICRELVERMGGSIGFTSKEGVGTVFTCIVPLGESPSEDTGSLPLPLQPEDAAAAMPHLGGERPRLLVAEDDPVIGHLLVKSLRKLNFRVDNVQDGMQVVEEWLRAEYDLVLMDIQMPRMDGFQATGAIRERERAAGKEGRTIIIAMTAHALKEDEERCLAAGMDAYISKPINLRESIELIKRLLAGKGL